MVAHIPPPPPTQSMQCDMYITSLELVIRVIQVAFIFLYIFIQLQHFVILGNRLFKIPNSSEPVFLIFVLYELLSAKTRHERWKNL